MSAPIRQEDFIQSVADAFQFISYYHPLDYIQALGRAYEREQSPAAKDAIAQILTNSRMCAEGQRPICQDTGIAVVFLKVGMNVQWDAKLTSRRWSTRACAAPIPTRTTSCAPRCCLIRPASAPTARTTPRRDPLRDRCRRPRRGHLRGQRRRLGKQIQVLRMLNPSDSIVDWVLKTVPTMGAGWCPPGILGIGIGGTPEKAMLLAKESLMAPVDIHELIAPRRPSNRVEALRLELFEKVNALGIGAQGLGGLTTVLDVKILDYPTHAASLPVAMIPNCAATRHVHFHLDGSGPAKLEPPSSTDWPQVTWKRRHQTSTRVNLDTLTPAEVAAWKPGQTLLLNGKMLTGRDAAHKRIQDMLAKGEKLPVDFTNRVIYYVGPVDPVRDEVVGPAGPTTATRMDKFTEMMLEQTGLISMVGKSERGPTAIEAIKTTQVGLPDGRRRRRLPGGQGDQGRQGGRLRRPGHGSDLRIRGQGHAGHGRRRFHRHLGAPDRAEGMAGEDRQDSGRRRLKRVRSP
jgi:fumarate hydratase class I